MLLLQKNKYININRWSITCVQKLGEFRIGELIYQDVNREIKLNKCVTRRYARMLRIIKRYKFPYRLNPSNPKSARVPGNSIVMTSYPGALSSQDESYMISGQNRELIVAGTPLIVDNHSLWSRLQTKDRVIIQNCITYNSYNIVRRNLWVWTFRRSWFFKKWRFSSSHFCIIWYVCLIVMRSHNMIYKSSE